MRRRTRAELEDEYGPMPNDAGPVCRCPRGGDRGCAVCESDPEDDEEGEMAGEMTITCGRLTVEEILDRRDLAIGVVLRKRGDTIHLNHEECRALRRLLAALSFHAPVAPVPSDAVLDADPKHDPDHDDSNPEHLSDPTPTLTGIRTGPLPPPPAELDPVARVEGAITAGRSED